MAEFGTYKVTFLTHQSHPLAEVRAWSEASLMLPKKGGETELREHVGEHNCQRPGLGIHG
jgi:hypothetical protein